MSSAPRVVVPLTTPTLLLRRRAPLVAETAATAMRLQFARRALGTSSVAALASRNQRNLSLAIGNGVARSLPNVSRRGDYFGISRGGPFPTSIHAPIGVITVRLQSTSASSASNDSSSSSSSSSSDKHNHSNTSPRRSRTTRFLVTTFLFFLSTTAGFAMASAPAADTVNGAINPPSDAETLTLFQPDTPSAQELNEQLINLPLAIRLRQQPELTEARPHMKIAAGMRSHNLTAGVLMGAEKLEIPPLYFTQKEGTEGSDLPTLTQINWVGPALCGHPGIVHGGLLATLLDEGLARCCFPALPNKVGVTANLKIDYRVPCTAGRFLVLKAQTTKVEGRKAWVKGWIEALNEDGSDGDGVKIVEAEALFIEPKQAKAMARVYKAT